MQQQGSEVAGELGGEGEAIVDGNEPRMWAENRFRLLVPTPSQFPSQFTRSDSTTQVSAIDEQDGDAAYQSLSGRYSPFS